MTPITGLMLANIASSLLGGLLGGDGQQERQSFAKSSDPFINPNDLARSSNMAISRLGQALTELLGQPIDLSRAIAPPVPGVSVRDPGIANPTIRQGKMAYDPFQGAAVHGFPGFPPLPSGPQTNLRNIFSPDTLTPGSSTRRRNPQGYL